MSKPSTTLSESQPYYDDYNASGNAEKNYLRILFKPGVSVQAREMNQLQTALQNQIAKLGGYHFKEGDFILDGNCYFQDNVDFIDIQFTSGIDDYVSTDALDSYKTFATDVASNSPYVSYGVVSCDIIARQTLSLTDRIYRFYVTYQSQSDTANKFPLGPLKVATPISDSSGNSLIVRGTTIGSVIKTGFSARIHIDSGISFVKGSFVYNDNQDIYVEKTEQAKLLNGDAALVVTEKIVTSVTDSSLNDNAAGYPNYTAPGADRYTIDLSLKFLTNDSSISGLPANSVSVIALPNTNIDYNIALNVVNSQGILPLSDRRSNLNDILAQRTFDESGQYFLNPFLIDLQDAYNDGYNRGKFGPNISENLKEQYDGQYMINLEPSTAYVKGYRVHRDDKISILANKARDTKAIAEHKFDALQGGYIEADFMFGLPKTVKDDSPNTYAFLYQGGLAKSTINPDLYTNQIGTTKIRSVEYTGKKYRAYLDLDQTVVYNEGQILGIPGMDGRGNSTTFNTNDKIYSSPQVLGGLLMNNSPGYGIPYPGQSFTNGDSGGDTTRDVTKPHIVSTADGSIKHIKVVSNFQENQAAGVVQNFSAASTKEIPGQGTGLELKITLKSDGNEAGSIENIEILNGGQGFAQQDILEIDPAAFGADSPDTAAAGHPIRMRLLLANIAGQANLSNAGVNLAVNKEEPGGGIKRAKYLIGPADHVDSTAFDSPDRCWFYAGDTDRFELKGQIGSNFLYPLMIADGYSSMDKSIVYTERVKLLGSSSITSASTSASFTISTGEFIFDDTNSYICTDVDGTHIPLAYVVRSNNNRTVTVHFDAGTINSRSNSNTSVHQINTGKPTLMASRTATAVAKSKTVRTVTLGTQISGPLKKGDTFDIGLTDVLTFKIVEDNSPFLTSSYKDVFSLDSGVRQNAYQNGKIVYNGDADLPDTFKGNVTVDYFEHSATGTSADNTFFSIASYDIGAGENQVRYKGLPDFNGVPVSEFLDFRSSNIDLDPNSTITVTNLKHYLPRKDRIIVTTNGEFKVIEGVAEEKPQFPKLPDDCMHLYDLHLPPFTYSAKSIKVDYIDHRRYTMDDIAGLDKRIENLEYYTSTTLLENQAQGTDLTDGSGTRFKNGIVVDSFVSHAVGDIYDPAYYCATDAEVGELRPGYDTKNITIYNDVPFCNKDVFYTGSTKTAGTVSGLDAAETIRLPVIAEKELITQLQGSTALSVNPYDVAAYVGVMKLSPESDNWKEVRRKPDVITDGGTDDLAVLEFLQSGGVFGTQWNEWEFDWHGIKQSGKGFNTSGHKRKAAASGDTAILKAIKDSAGQMSSFQIKNLRLPQRVEDVTWAGRPDLNPNNPRVPTKHYKTTVKFSGTRTGIHSRKKVSIVEKTSDKMVKKDFVPFIRSRKIYFNVKGLKPDTKFNIFFDKTQINDYCQTTSTVNKYTAPTNPGTTQHYADYYEMAGAAALAQADSGEGSVGRNANLRSDSAGQMQGYFIIPNTNALRFRTGVREVKVTDAGIPDDPNAMSFARATYSAQGVMEHHQRTITSIRKISVVTVNANDSFENATISQNTKQYYDPLAQSFIVGERPEGVYLTSIDLYFQAKHDKLPLTMRLVSVENGIPTINVIPFSEVVKLPVEVNISNDASVATTFRFEEPVYLPATSEYAIVVLSNSPDYKMWLSELGGDDVLTGQRIAKNPYAGVSFKSQNAVTWTPDQEKDFKMVVRYAEFGPVDVTGKLTGGDIVKAVSADGTGHGDFKAVVPIDYSLANPTAAENKQIEFSGLLLDAETLELPDTRVDFSAIINNQMTGGSSQEISLVPGEAYYFDDIQKITDFEDRSQFQLNATLSSKIATLTPQIDLERLSLTTINYVVNGAQTIDTSDSPNGDTELSVKHGKAKARYLTRFIGLDTASDRINVFMDINRPNELCDVRVYVRFGSDENFTRMQGDVIQVTGDDSTFLENKFQIDLGPAYFEAGAKGSTGTTKSQFDEFQIKIVMLADRTGNTSSTRTARVPKVKNFRAIATT